MKKYGKRYLAIALVVALLFSLSGIPGLAASLKPTAPASPVCVWHTTGTVKSTQQNKDTFVINAPIDIDTSAEDDTGYGDLNVNIGSLLGFAYDIKMYITFPVEGGFRLRLSEKASESGFFNPSALSDITYQTLDDGRIMMYGMGDTVLYYQKTASGFTMSVGDKKGNISLTFTDDDIYLGYQKDKIVRTKMTLPLATEEAIYNGSERFNDVNQVGYVFSLRNEDTGYHGVETPSEEHTNSYINVPIFHSSEGYSVWYNMTYTGTADIGVADASAYTVDFDGSKFDFYMWNGTILENIKKYTAITGTSYVPPKWAFGYWLGAQDGPWRTNQTTGTTYADGSAEAIQQAYDNLVDMFEGYEAMGITDIAAVYGEGLNSTTNAAAYAYVNSRGSRMLMWYHPHAYTVSTLQTLLPGVSRNNLPLPLNLVNPVAGNYMGDFIDFSHPNAVNAITGFFNGGTSYTKNLKYWDLGLKGAMIDYGEWLRDDTLLYNGLKGDEMHNFISYYYAKAQMEAWDSYYPDHDYILFERSGVAGSQKFVANFTGDQKAGWMGLTDQIRGILSMSTGGFNIVGGDMGGFKGQPDEELYARWVAFSTFSPLMRTHGSIKNPWKKGTIAKNSFPTYYWFRMNMQDLLYSAAIDANKNATPMAMPLGVAYQGQKNVKSINDQYLFCNSFLVNPVVESRVKERTLWLPEGNWYDLWTCRRVEGNQMITADASYATAPVTIPVYIKSGAAVAVELPDTMMPMESMEGKVKYKGLLITPADNLTNTPVYTSVEEEPVVYTSRYIGANAYSLTASKDSNRRMLVAYGTNATSVTVDGVALNALDHVPNITQNENGFYADGADRTFILLPEGWKTVRIAYASNASGETFDASLSGFMGFNAAGDSKYPNGNPYIDYSDSKVTAEQKTAYKTYMQKMFAFAYNRKQDSVYVSNLDPVTNNYARFTGLYSNRYLQTKFQTGYGASSGCDVDSLALLIPKDESGNLLVARSFTMKQQLRIENATYGAYVIGFHQSEAGRFYNGSTLVAGQGYIKISPENVQVYDGKTVRTVHTYTEGLLGTNDNYKDIKVSIAVRNDYLYYNIVSTHNDIAVVSGKVKLYTNGNGYISFGSAKRHTSTGLPRIEVTDYEPMGEPVGTGCPGITTDKAVQNGRFNVTRVGGADANGYYQYNLTVSADAGYELKAGSLLVTDSTGEPQVPVNSTFQTNGTGKTFTFYAKGDAVISGRFFRPNKTVVNAAAIGTSYNAQRGGLRFVYRIQRKVENGKEYILLDGNWHEIVDYGMLIAVDYVVGNQRLDAELAETNPYVQKHSAKVANRYYDSTDEYVDISMQVVNMHTSAAYKTLDMVSNAYVQLADGTYLYANGYTTNYVAAGGPAA